MVLNRALIPIQRSKFIIDTHDPKALARPSYLPTSYNYATTQTDAVRLSVIQSIESTNESHEFFRAKASELDQLWSEFQSKKIYKTHREPITEQQFKEDMKLFMSVFLDYNPGVINRLKELCTLNIDDDPKNKFPQLDLRYQKITLDNLVAFYDREYNYSSGDGTFDYSSQTLSYMSRSDDPKVQKAAKRIWQYAFRYLGNESTWMLIPNTICKEALKRNEKLINEFNEMVSHKGFNYLGSGDVGLVYAVTDEFGNKVAMKVSKYPQESDFGTILANQEDQIKKLGEFTSHLPISYYLPQLIIDGQGQSLGIHGKVAVFKHLSGNRFFTESKDKNNPNAPDNLIIGNLDPDFRLMGLDRQFVVDFMSFYLQACKQGIDTHDIRPGNFYINGPAFELVELGGLNSDDSRKLIQLKKEKPEAFLLYTLMESFYMVGIEDLRSFSPRRFSALQEPKLVNEKGYAPNSSKRIKELVTMRLGNFYDSLEEAVSQGVLTYHQIRKGIRDLKAINADKENMPPLMNLARSTTSSTVYSANEVLDMLDSCFKDRVGMAKYVKKTKRYFSNSLLIIAEKIKSHRNLSTKAEELH
jgi:hypothetical protein